MVYNYIVFEADTRPLNSRLITNQIFAKTIIIDFYRVLTNSKWSLTRLLYRTY